MKKKDLPITEKQIEMAMETLLAYKQSKALLEKRIVENEQFYRLRHWDVEGRTPGAIEPTSAWLFNSLAGKHADAMDNYPEPTVLPREEKDEKEAEHLSAILPVILERCDFEQIYSDAWWYKLKNGASCYGVFWDGRKEQGLGDIAIARVDLLNLFWEPGITNLQDSENIFLVSLVDEKALKVRYPDFSSFGSVLDIAEYRSDEYVDNTKKVTVVDWYYKVHKNEKTILHFCKFAGNTLLYASENDPVYKDRGFYDHGQYPFVLDVLYPVEGSPVGFGCIDLMRDPQVYIDKLNKIIMTNAAMSGKPRFFIKDNGAVNEEEFADWNNQDFVHVAGSLDETNIRQIGVDRLDGYIVQHLLNKVDELKETSGNRDFNQGASSAGVTAASAITALQEAGNKLSRDMYKASYRAYRKICWLMIELMRQFYTDRRYFRITGTGFMTYSNHDLNRELSHPSFDIAIKAQKSNPFSREGQNQMALQLFQAGFFEPRAALSAITALELMEFEGKEKVAEKIRKHLQITEEKNDQHQSGNG